MEVTDIQYKESEIGVIPVDWEVKKLFEISDLATGNTPPTNDPTNYGDEFLFVSPADLGKGKWITQTEKKLSKKGFSISRKFPKNSILFTCIGSTIGKSGMAQMELTSNQQINAVIPSSKYANEFIFYALDYISPRIKLLAGEQAVPIVNKTLFGETLLAIPPTKSEQTAIATALSDTDALIENLEKLIAKKRNIKQGVMQELLTGRKRLAGFNRDWVKIKTGEVADIHKGNGLSKTKLKSEGKYGCILYGELFTTYKRIIKNAISRTDYEEGVYSKAGDILMPGSTTTTGIDLAIASAVLKDNILLGGDINVIRPKTASINSIFLSYYITEILKHKILELTRHIFIIDLIEEKIRLQSVLQAQMPGMFLSIETQFLHLIAPQLKKRGHLILCIYFSFFNYSKRRYLNYKLVVRSHMFIQNI